jgi:nucleotide-binding universal stress UspA family protein/predicted transcriptional regulator
MTAMTTRRTIVVPIIGPQLDPEKVSEQALPTARALAERTGAALLLVSVMNVIEEFGDLPETELDRQETYLFRAAGRRAYMEALLEDYPGEARAHVLFGDAPDELLEFVDTLEQPIIVMSSHGRKGLRRLILGSVAFEVVQRAWCPVMVVPARLTDEAPRRSYQLERVLVPLDRTPLAESALDMALRELGPGPLDIRLVQVIPPLAQTSSSLAGQHYAAARVVSHEYLQQVAQRLTFGGHRVTCDIRMGQTEQELLEAAFEHNAGAIVMATRGRTGISRFIFGSVSEGLVQGGTTPLLVVRPSEEAVAEYVRRGRSAPHAAHTLPEERTHTAAELMSQPIVSVGPDDTLEAVATLMLEHRIGCVPVVDARGVMVGIITESDFTGKERDVPFAAYRMPQLFGEWLPHTSLEQIYAIGRTLRARQVMSWPVVSATEDEPITRVAERMVRRNVNRIPVLREGVPVGMLTRHDLLKLFILPDGPPGATHPERST